MYSMCKVPGLSSLFNLNASFRLLGWMEGTSGERPMTTTQDHSGPVQLLPFSSLDNRNFPPLTWPTFHVTFLSIWIWGKTVHSFFSSPNFYFPFQSGDTAAHPTSSDRQQPDQPPLLETGKSIVSFFSIPKSQTIIIKHYIYWKFL